MQPQEEYKQRRLGPDKQRRRRRASTSSAGQDIRTTVNVVCSGLGLWAAFGGPVGWGVGAACAVWGAADVAGVWDDLRRRQLSVEEADDFLAEHNAGLIDKAWCTGTFHN